MCHWHPRCLEMLDIRHRYGIPGFLLEFAVAGPSPSFKLHPDGYSDDSVDHFPSKEAVSSDVIVFYPRVEQAEFTRLEGPAFTL